VVDGVDLYEIAEVLNMPQQKVEALAVPHPMGGLWTLG
jgi:hypothetical protein